MSFSMIKSRGMFYPDGLASVMRCSHMISQSNRGSYQAGIKPHPLLYLK
jgi:hypothetical protein